jgi:Flp pilus assembly protein TadG
MRINELFTHESGNALVELAVSLPLFVLLIAGTAEIANVGWASVQLNNAAHAAAQFGSISRTNAADTPDIATTAENEAPNFITSATQVTSALDCSCITPSTGAQTTPVTCTSTYATTAPCASPNVILTSVQVTVQATVRPIVHYPGFPATYTLHGKASMGIVQ